MSATAKDWIFNATLLGGAALLGLWLVLGPLGAAGGQGPLAGETGAKPAKTPPGRVGIDRRLPTSTKGRPETSYNPAAGKPGAAGRTPARPTPSRATPRTKTTTPKLTPPKTPAVTSSTPARPKPPSLPGKATPTPEEKKAAAVPKPATQTPPVAVVTPSPSPKTSPGAQATSGTLTTGTQVAAAPPEMFRYLGKVNIFEPLFTPTPTPTPRPKPTPRPPSLALALRDWVLEYPLSRGKYWMFSDRRRAADPLKKVEVGKPYKLRDPRAGEFEVMITRYGKWGVTFVYEGPPKQTKNFSLIE